MSVKRVEVAVGVILRGDKIFLTKRAEHLHQGGKWEFPGGKRESNETMLDALARELKEEVAIDVKSATSLIEIHHDYDDKSVFLDVYTVSDFAGEPNPAEGQKGDWFNKTELESIDFPAANAAIIEALNRS